MKELESYLVSWIDKQVLESGSKGGLVGLSGGIDSAVVAALLKKAFPKNSLAVIMPCNSSEEDNEYARLVSNSINIETLEYDLSMAFENMVATISAGKTQNKLALSNIKPRLRMTTLYYLAAKMNYLVVGTGNKSEIMVGYFTKYGDAGVDIEPLGNMYKHQVYQLARHLNLPEEIIKRPPTAGLWANQTDEDELGITYEELDKYLYAGQGTEQTANIAQRLIKTSEHKRKMPPVPDKQFPLNF